jgi:TPP-dependent pyruvate/acetoin dehydrogenase alpha subunit
MATKVKDKAAVTAASKNGFSLISDSKLKRIYSAMLTKRAMEERSAPISGRKKSSAGLEAMEIGAAINLLPGDHLSPARSSLLDAVLKINTKRVIVHSTPVKQQLQTILDTARDLKSRGKLNIVLAFFDGKATTNKAWSKALSASVVEALPILFVLSGSAAELGTDEIQEVSVQLNGKNKKLFFPVIPVDGKDVVAVYRVAFESGARVREGGGPALIFCKMDDLHGEQSATRDPIDFMEGYLTAKGLYKLGWKTSVLRRLNGAGEHAAIR